MRTKQQLVLTSLALGLGLLLGGSLWFSRTVDYNVKVLEMHQAVAGKDKKTIKAYLDDGIDINANNGGWTALHFAANRGDPDMIVFLMRLGANPNLRNDNGRTPLHLALMWGGLDAVKALLNDKTDLNAPDYYGMTPLHFAAEKGSLEAVTFLLDKGADATLKDDRGLTPIGRASGDHADRIVERLSAPIR